jgi:alkanesulfonate monooxygenase SsuD/methylene tetrahydromethanopterin reductase-like flavin-dependent oxidoreductase (luciferase family)
MKEFWSPAEQAAIQHRTLYCAVGSPQTVQRRLQEILEETKADELIATAQIYDHKARLHSFEIAANIFVEMNAARDSKNCAAAL